MKKLNGFAVGLTALACLAAQPHVHASGMDTAAAIADGGPAAMRAEYDGGRPSDRGVGCPHRRIPDPDLDRPRMRRVSLRARLAPLLGASEEKMKKAASRESALQ